MRRDLKGSNSALSQAVLIYEASALTAWRCLCAPPRAVVVHQDNHLGKKAGNTSPTVYPQGGNSCTEAQCSLQRT